MGKKVNWFSAIKKALTPNSKQKEHETDKKSSKKWGLGKIKHGGNTSFIPLYRKPSSIEKILGEAEKEQQSTQHAASSDEWRKPSTPIRAPQRHVAVNYDRTYTAKNQNVAATKIQAAYKGYTARRDIRALKGMVRLQGVVRGQNVKRQTMNAMKQMQLLVKVQNKIQLRRINMLENQVQQNLDQQKNDREVESSLGRWNLSQASEASQNDEWDDSLLTKEEIEARIQRKAEALMKRERIQAYANSHQWIKPGSAQMSPMDLRVGALPWWWLRIEQQFPKHSVEPATLKNKSPQPTPSLEPNLRPQSKPTRFGVEIPNSVTPRFSPSPLAPTPTRPKQSPIPSYRLQESNTSTPVKHAKPRANGNDFSYSLPLRDDDSFTSCPPLSTPNYMTPTISAKAKLRAYNNSVERSPATPTPGQKRRSSFPLTQSFSSIRWKRASSLFSNKDSSSQRLQSNNRSMSVLSVGNLSVDSTTSMPAAVGRKPFNRFV